MHLLKESPAGIKGTELEELYTEAHYAAWSAEKRRRYEELIMNRHDYDVVLQHSYDMGIQAGIEKGREEGRMTAILQNAQKMKQLGIDDETIMRVTGLDKEMVNSL